MKTLMFLQNRLLLLVLVLAVPAWPQTQPPAQPPAEPPQPVQQPSGPQNNAGAEEAPVADDRAPVPMPVNGGNSLAFSSEEARTNYLRGGLSVGSAYDDNALNTPVNSSSNPVGDFSYTVLPHIAWSQSTSRLRWTLNYAAGLIANQHVSERNQAAHDLGIDFKFRLSPHVDLSVGDHFSITTGFFDQFQGNGDTSSGGVLQGPNQSVITPLARHTGNLGTAAITYQFGAGSVIGASGTFYNSHYGDVAAAPAGLVDTRTEGAEGFYTHRISPRNWAGVTYKFQQLSFDPSGDRTATHSLMYFHTIYLQPKMQVSFFAGPEYADLESQTTVIIVNLPFVNLMSVSVHQKRWSAAGGASYGWQGERTSVRAEFVRRISDGGGILNTVQLTSGSGALRRQLTRSSTLEFGAGYATSAGLSGSSTAAAGSLKSATGSIAIERRLGNNLGLRLGYARDYQQQPGSVPVTGDVNHNRGYVTVSYNFSRPIGR